MPIEIRELHINIAVTSEGPKKQGVVGPSAAGGSKDNKNALIAECVEQVLIIIENKAER